MTIPAQRCAELIYDSDITKRTFLHAMDMHRQEIRKGTIQTLLGIFKCRAIEKGVDDIYLFDRYRFV